MIKGTCPDILGQLYNGPQFNHNPLPFLEDNNSTVDLEKGGR